MNFPMFRQLAAAALFIGHATTGYATTLPIVDLTVTGEYVIDSTSAPNPSGTGGSIPAGTATVGGNVSVNLFGDNIPTGDARFDYTATLRTTQMLTGPGNGQFITISIPGGGFITRPAPNPTTVASETTAGSEILSPGEVQGFLAAGMTALDDLIALADATTNGVAVPLSSALPTSRITATLTNFLQSTTSLTFDYRLTAEAEGVDFASALNASLDAFLVSFGVLDQGVSLFNLPQDATGSFTLTAAATATEIVLAPVPLPATMPMLLLAAAGFFGIRRLRKPD